MVQRRTRALAYWVRNIALISPSGIATTAVCDDTDDDFACAPCESAPLSSEHYDPLDAEHGIVSFPRRMLEEAPLLLIWWCGLAGFNLFVAAIYSAVRLLPAARAASRAATATRSSRWCCAAAAWRMAAAACSPCSCAAAAACSRRARAMLTISGTRQGR